MSLCAPSPSSRDRLSAPSRLFGLPLFGLILFVGGLTGCGGYSQSTREARQALRDGRVELAAQKLDELIEGADEAEAPLLHLERAITRQRLGDHSGASRDFELADQALEVLDYTNATPQEVARYVFSDDSAPYKAPAYEKALINLLNMASYLARGDVKGAQVEGRRFLVYQDYLQAMITRGDREAQEGAELSALLSIGATLGAYSALSAGQLTEAARWAQGDEPLLALIERAKRDLELPPEQRPAHLLVLSSVGQIAYNRAVRLPLARAIVVINAHPSHGGLSEAERRQALMLSVRASTKWLNFVELVEPTLPPARPQLLKGPSPVGALARGANLTSLARYVFAQQLPQLIAASISRLLTRAVTGAVTEGVSKQKLGGLGGALLGGATELLMSGLDTPDTRSWSSLPHELKLSWLILPPGQYQLSPLTPQERPLTFKLRAGEQRTLTLPLSSPAEVSPTPHP